MRNLFILLLAFTLVQTASAQVSSDKKPDIFFTETAHDFGQITDAAPVRWDFTFFNSGKAALLLKNVQASCGCTTPTWPKQPIMPGDSAKITAEFNPRGYAGQSFQKTVTVTTNIDNNGQDKIIILNFKGSVKAAQTNQ
jgi:hypothetical protein